MASDLEFAWKKTGVDQATGRSVAHGFVFMDGMLPLAIKVQLTFEEANEIQAILNRAGERAVQELVDAKTTRIVV